MNEHKPLDSERMMRSGKNFERDITAGISTAQFEAREISTGIARMIAHVLGRALGTHSELAAFGRMGEANHELMRAEYLELYNDSNTPSSIRHWIDWFGTYLVEREDLEALAEAEAAREQEPEKAEFGDADAYRVFLTLGIVEPDAPDAMQRFSDLFAGEFATLAEAVRGLSPLEDWQADLDKWRAERGIDPDVIRFNLKPLLGQLEYGYQLVERNDRVYAFVK
ncbi:hypothetical protein [Agrococcus sp. Ld7]|uniref:hypothetical protein n=1 Tax=Agrococcus sp. Ld7 TaxID=649148 RepID=UPI003866AE02